MAEAASKPAKKKGNANSMKVTRAQILQAQMAALNKNKGAKKDKKLVEQNVDLEENLNSLSKFEPRNTGGSVIRYREGVPIRYREGVLIRYRVLRIFRKRGSYKVQPNFFRSSYL